MSNKTMKWEQFSPDVNKTPERLSNLDNIWRTKVPGGWLMAYGIGSICFLPDSKYEWDKILEENK